jgi:hypothetical protein
MFFQIPLFFDGRQLADNFLDDMMIFIKTSKNKLVYFS